MPLETERLPCGGECSTALGYVGYSNRNELFGFGGQCAIRKDLAAEAAPASQSLRGELLAFLCDFAGSNGIHMFFHGFRSSVQRMLQTGLGTPVLLFHSAG